MIYFNNRNGSSGLTCRLNPRLISATAIYGRWNSSLCWKDRWYPTHRGCYAYNLSPTGLKCLLSWSVIFIEFRTEPVIQYTDIYMNTLEYYPSFNSLSSLFCSCNIASFSVEAGPRDWTHNFRIDFNWKLLINAFNFLSIAPIQRPFLPYLTQTYQRHGFFPLSLSHSFRLNQLSLFGSPLDGMKCLSSDNECKSLLVA